MSDNARKTGAAIEAHFQFLMWLVPTVEKFPRPQKLLLGDRIQTTARNSPFWNTNCCGLNGIATHDHTNYGFV